MTATEKLPGVAKNIYMFCSKCDCDRYFRVLSHTSETEARVECEVCGAKRKYKLGGKVTKKKTTRKRKNKHLELWTELQEKNKEKVPLAYATTGQFPVDSVIDHPTFGVGFVTSSLNHKIEVVFEESTKTLMHQRS